MELFLLMAMVNNKHHSSMSSWVKLSGSDGKDICVNEKGEFFLVNTANKLYKYEGPKWKENTNLKPIKSYTENKGIRVFLHNRCLIRHGCKKQGGKMIGTSTLNDCAYDKEPIDLAIASDSTIWHVDSYSKKLIVSKCEININVPGSNISRIAVGEPGQVWMINNKGLIFRLKDPVHVNMGWEQMPGSNARDIAVSNDGYVFLVGEHGRIFQWSGFKWVQLDGSDGLRIAANNRKLLLINTQREIYTRNY
jgi:hypothetical protein